MIFREKKIEKSAWNYSKVGSNENQENTEEKVIFGSLSGSSNTKYEF
jgi:hypothetical protein